MAMADAIFGLQFGWRQTASRTIACIGRLSLAERLNLLNIHNCVMFDVTVPNHFQI